MQMAKPHEVATRKRTEKTMDTKYVLVTGGAGYIGSHMTLALLDAGAKPIVVDNLTTGIRSAVPSSGSHSFTATAVDQALRFDDIMKNHDVDAIVHFAANIIVADSSVDPLGYYRNNTGNTRALIDPAVRNGIPEFRLLIECRGLWRTNTAIISEDHPTNPINPYGRPS